MELHCVCYKQNKTNLKNQQINNRKKKKKLSSNKFNLLSS